MQPKQIHELLDSFPTNPNKAIELAKNLLKDDDETPFSLWLENERLNGIDSACGEKWPTRSNPNKLHLTICCNTCGLTQSSSLCLSCYLKSVSKNSIRNSPQNYFHKLFPELDYEPHKNHDVYFKFTRNGQCSCGDINSMNSEQFCPLHTYMPNVFPNIETTSNDQSDLISDLTDICFRTIVDNASLETNTVQHVINFLIGISSINSTYLHLIAAGLSEYFDTSAIFTHWPRFTKRNSIQILKLIDFLSVDHNFLYAFSASFFDNYIYLISYDLNRIGSLSYNCTIHSTVSLLAISELAWDYIINHDEMIEESSIIELIGKEFYIITSFIKSDPFHPLVMHSLIRNFFNTMSIFFSTIPKNNFLKKIASPESLGSLSDIYVDALNIELFPIVTKEYVFYSMKDIDPSDDMSYFNTVEMPDDHIALKPEKNSNADLDEFKLFFEPEQSHIIKQPEFIEQKNQIPKQIKQPELLELPNPNQTAQINSNQNQLNPNQNNQSELNQMKKENLQVYLQNQDNVGQFNSNIDIQLVSNKSINDFQSYFENDEWQDDINTAITTKQRTSTNLYSIDNHLIYRTFSTTTDWPVRFIRCSLKLRKNLFCAIEPLYEIEQPSTFYIIPLLCSMLKHFFTTMLPAHFTYQPTLIKHAIVEKEEKSDLKSKMSMRNTRKMFMNNENTLTCSNLLCYYNNPEPFFYRSSLDPMSLCYCSSPCHSIAFRKLCTTSTNGINDWKECLNESSIYEIMFCSSNYLRKLYNNNEVKGIEKKMDIKTKMFLDDVSLLCITIIPLRKIALQALVDLDVVKPHKITENDNKLIFNMFLKYSDFNYDVIGAYSAAICAMSFASNISLMAFVTFNVFDLKNEITTEKVFAYFNFLLTVISDHSVFVKNKEVLLSNFLKSLLMKKGEMTGKEILNEVDRFFCRKTDKELFKQKYENEIENETYFSSNSDSIFDLDDNDFEDNLIEEKMKRKNVDELDDVELLSGKRFLKRDRTAWRFPRPMVKKVLNEICEEFNDDLNNRKVYRLKENFETKIQHSIFNTASENRQLWNSLIEKFPKTAFMRVCFDPSDKPDGFSPQSIFVTSEFFSILFIIGLKMFEDLSKFDQATIHIFFALLTYISQFSAFCELSKNQEKKKIQLIVDDLNSIIKDMPGNYSDFLTTSITFDKYKNLTFEKIILGFGEIGEIYLKYTTDKIKKINSIEKLNGFNFYQFEKPNFMAIRKEFESKCQNYLNPFVSQFQIPEYFDINKQNLISVPIEIFDGFCGRQMWTSHNYFNAKLEKAFTYSQSKLPINFDSNFSNLFPLIEKSDFINQLISEFHSPVDEYELLNCLQSTIERIELRLRSNPFVLDDKRVSILLGNAFRLFWLYSHSKIFKIKSELPKTTIKVSRTNQITDKLTLLLVLLANSDTPVESYRSIVQFVYAIENNRSTFLIDYDGIRYLVQNYNVNNQNNDLSDLLFLRLVLIVKISCLWDKCELPSSFYDLTIPNALVDLCELFDLPKVTNPVNTLDVFQFVELPRNFFEFAELPFAYNDLLSNNSCSIHNSQTINSPTKSKFDYDPIGILDNQTESVDSNQEKSSQSVIKVLDLISGEIGDIDNLKRKSKNSSIFLSLNGKETGLCFSYNISLDKLKQVSSIYFTDFGESGIESGELLYLNSDRVMKLEDQFLSGELFL